MLYAAIQVAVMEALQTACGAARVRARSVRVLRMQCFHDPDCQCVEHISHFKCVNARVLGRAVSAYA